MGDQGHPDKQGDCTVGASRKPEAHQIGECSVELGEVEEIGAASLTMRAK